MAKKKSEKGDGGDGVDEDVDQMPLRELGGARHAGGGSSATKWRTNLVAMKFAVDGWRARSASGKAIRR